MSILVKGMEIPKNCFVCRFKHLEICDGDCPLIEVTTPHGRLIDADELSNHMVKVHKEWVENPELHNSVIQTIDDEIMLLYAPTIIEAEGGE